MESDSIRPSGSNTLVDVWIDGKLRAITVTKDAIGAFLGFARAEGMSEHDRCEFVRTHLSLVVAAAKSALGSGNPLVDSLVIAQGQLRGAGNGPRGERRKGERRQEERRKSDRLPPGQPDRRRGPRRKGERRARTPKPD